MQSQWGYRQLYYGLSGGILAHANGLTLSQPLGDTLILVRAPVHLIRALKTRRGGCLQTGGVCCTALCNRLS
ncbi:fimbria/pilus outer membrane usher protein [Escherichia coli]|uniref:fimbria/pilus outer membrane usher protein n=1 Tax=Escherichia coli TaxID=562 RepID=UPI003EBAD1A2